MTGGDRIQTGGPALADMGTVKPGAGPVGVARQRPETASTAHLITAATAPTERLGGMDGPSENPELWAFLESLHCGEMLSGTVTAIERFGVFVALDEGPDHPVFPGVGFITIPELSWRRFEAASDVVHVGQRVSCEFLQFDTWNLEARLSLRATQPDPFQQFADRIAVGQTLHGQVTKLVPFGVFVRVADEIEGLVHLLELVSVPVEAPSDVVQVGDEITVVVTAIDAERRRLTLSRRQVSPDRR
ncbi:S1 RNA-binding domain-containing protein [Streptomyces sp. NPDC052101]|uniref:S1 RNA-binding domain-containing protein n=1 Tax=Streptomyces sp. NPDC052101 TaxID=3155763 RepID=UPI00342982A7